MLNAYIYSKYKFHIHDLIENYMKLKLLLLFFFFGFRLIMFGQICGTSSYSNESQLQKLKSQKSNNQYLASSTGICVNVNFLIVRQSNGSGGFNISNLDNIITKLNESFYEHRIYFNSIGHDFIDNSTYYNIDDTGNSTTEFDALVQIKNNPNAINIYLVNNAVSYAGRANGILSQALVIENFYATSQVIAHEVGHCFNLYHTHRGTWQCESNSSTCAEIDGVNNATCGDKVVDTPADPGLLAFDSTCNVILNYLVDSSCNYIGGNGFNPDTNNIMSYAPVSCLEHFTSGQNNRMRQAFASYSVLQNVISTSCSIPEFTGPDLICNTDTVFSLQNGGTSVTWQVSSNLQILSSSNTGITVKPINNTIIGSGYIKAVLPYETLQKDVWIGTPLIDYDINENFTICRDINSTSNNFLPVFIQGMDVSTTWEVQRITNNHNVSMQGSEVLVSLNYAPPYNYIAFKVRASNACGFSNWLQYYVEVVDSCESENYNRFIVYPNPASDIINIRAKMSKEEIIDPISYQIYDLNGIVIENGDLRKQSIIDLSNYKKGSFILKIDKDIKSEIHKIIIK